MRPRSTTVRTLVIASLVMVTACADPPASPEVQIALDAAAALGGRERIDAVRTITLEGDGTQFNLGQDVRPGAAGQTFTVSGLVRRMDLAAGRLRTELTRTPAFAYFQGPAPQRQVQGLDGSLAYNVGAGGNPTRVSDQVTADRRADFYHHPITLVRAALAPGASLTNPRQVGAERVVDVKTPDGVTLVLTVDARNLPVRIESPSAHPNLGDVTMATTFADYRDTSGVMLPTRVATYVDDFKTADLRYATLSVDADFAGLAAEQVATLQQAPPPAPPAPLVTPEPLAPGVWLLAGQSHHSALVEMRDHLLLVDAPQSEARTRAVIAKARELVPGKPLTKVITTHHHFDHTAGIRAAVAEGLTIVTQAGNKGFFEEMTRRPHTILPDTLAKQPRPATVETVADELIIKDASRTVALYHVAGNPHSDTMLMIHLPAERLLVEVDAFSPGGAVNPYAANLLENITRRKLAVDRIVPLHGTSAPLADLVKVAGAP